MFQVIVLETLEALWSSIFLPTPRWGVVVDEVLVFAARTVLGYVPEHVESINGY